MAHLVSCVILNIEAGTTGGPMAVKVDKIPTECPLCHVTVKPEYLPGGTPTRASDWLEVYHRCSACGRHFTAIYKYEKQEGVNLVFAYSTSCPRNPVVAKFDDEIITLSPRFVSIFAQPAAAEAAELDEIAGPGYRKALEFLVKDYAIYLNPKDSDKIKALQFASVVATYLQGDKLPIVSARAGWLGNDEIHYEKRWVDKSLEDLKKLIGATVHFIAMERLVAALPAMMPKP